MAVGVGKAGCFCVEIYGRSDKNGGYRDDSETKTTYMGKVIIKFS